MLMKLLMLAGVAAGVLIMLAWEILKVGVGRREGIAPLILYKRFRRRAKQSILLGLLLAMLIVTEDLFRVAALTVGEQTGFYGVLITLAVWLLILSGRDLREAVIHSMEEKRRLRGEALNQLESTLNERRSDRHDR